MTGNTGGFQRVTVLGAGTMGHGIAQVCAATGLETVLYDISREFIDGGLARIRSNLDKGVARGKVTEEARTATLEKLRGDEDLAASVGAADIVIEAAPEKLDLKRELLGKVAASTGEGVVIGTNTSSLSVAAIAQDLPDPSRVVGMHFFNPVHIMKLLEIIVPDVADETVVARVQELGAALGKECIVVKDSPGFATSRLGLVIGLEAIRMLEQGVAGVEDIDKAMTLGYGFPMGPLKLTDLVGLDVRLHIARYLSEHLEDGAHFRPPVLLEKMVAEGKLGKKSGQGFYDWA
jgi:3-hydroxybutyryl-CoA dehydrogenase